MAGQNQRLNVVPTVTMLGVMKARLVGATRGHALLKKKSDALTVQFRQILKKIVSTKESMGEVMKSSSFALTEVKYCAGENIKHIVLENVQNATLKVRSRQENIAGVKLPKFEYFSEGETKNDLTGLARGGQQVQACRAAYVKAIELLVELASPFKLTDRSLYALAHGCPNLKKLNISGCTAFSDNGIAYVSEHCRKLEVFNLCGCVKGATDKALKAIGYYCNRLQSVTLGWCEKVGDEGVMSLAYGCPDLRALDLCGCVLITDESVIALANNCPHLRSLGLYYCQNITDRAMYSLAQSRAKKHKHEIWQSMKKSRYHEEEGLMNLNISQCTALTPPAVQAVCDSFPALHTCPGRHSLIISGCLSLTSVHCACAVQAHRAHTAVPHTAH